MNPRPHPRVTRRSFGAMAVAGTGAALPLAALPAASADGRSDDSAEEQVEELLAGMSVEQKIGQLFVPYAYGSTADESRPENTDTAGVDTIAEIIRTHHVGGLIYFAWSDNLQDPEQIAQLSNDSQDAALASGGIPLLVGTDEERGVVSRLPAPAVSSPGAMAIGATGSRRHASRAGRLVGTELLACGISQSYTPVVDVNIEARNPVIGVRSFGADPEAVATLGAAQVEALHRAEVASTVKHFPGHGDTATDSHLGLPVIDHTREELDEIDLPPFRRAIASGVDAIMTAHIVVPVLDDSGVPATLSGPVLTGLLRQELGFEGVIITDSLSMDGVRSLFPDDRVPVEAILAGADQMLMPPDLTVAIQGVRDAVAGGEITEERLDASVRRILLQKVRRGVLGDPHVDVGATLRRIGAHPGLRSAEIIADDAVTLVTNEDALPRAAGSSVLVTGAASQATLDALVAELGEHGIDATALLLEDLDEAAAQEAARAAADHDCALVLTSSSGFETPPEQVAVVTAVAGSGTPVVHASLRNPYDVVHVGPVAASVAVYDWSTSSVRALGRLVAGRIPARGSLPVPIPTADGTGEAYPIGHGLDLGAA